LIRLIAPQAETEAFLAREPTGVFPPGAYTLGPELRGSLDSLPDLPLPSRSAPELPLIGILPFPDFTESGLRDYAGRSPKESLDAIRIITGLSLPIIEKRPAGSQRPVDIVLGRRFWNALIRGGYQGAVYVIDTILGGQSSV
jgi:hypothetical protein